MRDGGYIYGRGTLDDKDNLTAALMVMLQLKRLNVPLDRDVIRFNGSPTTLTGLGNVNGIASATLDGGWLAVTTRRLRAAGALAGSINIFSSTCISCAVTS